MKYLKIHSLERGQWYDRDDILLHAAFQILIDFIELEKPGEIVDWEHNEEVKHIWSEIQALYRWWKEERPARKSPLDDETLAIPPFEFEPIPDSDYFRMIEPDRDQYKEYYQASEKNRELQEQWEAEDQQNLRRLIDIRVYLWT